MRYSPTPNNRKAFVTMLTLFIIAAALFLMSNLNIAGAGFLQLLSLCFAGGGVFMFVRYRTVYYTYVICPKEAEQNDGAVPSRDIPVNLNFISSLDFIVERENGRRGAWTECRVGVDELIDCFDYSPQDKDSVKHLNDIRKRGASAFFYTVSFKGDEYLACVFRSQDYGEILAVIEPAARMHDFLMAAARKNGGM